MPRGFHIPVAELVPSLRGGQGGSCAPHFGFEVTLRMEHAGLNKQRFQ